MQPRTLSFGQLSKSETGKKDLVITVTEPDKVKITSVTVEDKRFTLRPIDKNTGKYELTFKGSKAIERISSSVHIVYDGSDVKSMDIPIRANVVGNLRYPRNLFFLRRGGQFKPRDIAITTRSGNPIKIKSAKDPAQNLKLEITAATGQRTVVRASVASPNKNFAAPIEGTLVVKTTDKDEPELRVVYRIAESMGQRINAPSPPSANIKRNPWTPPNPK